MEAFNSRKGEKGSGLFALAKEWLGNVGFFFARAKVATFAKVKKIIAYKNAMRPKAIAKYSVTGTRPDLSVLKSLVFNQQ